MGADPKHVFRTIKTVWTVNSNLIISTLIDPGFGDLLDDAKTMATWVKENVSVNVPIQLLPLGKPLTDGSFSTADLVSDIDAISSQLEEIEAIFMETGLDNIMVSDLRHPKIINGVKFFPVRGSFRWGTATGS
jgi:pyruvate-formate lyase-activating enzyme